jgi:hypothetical protein
VRRLCGHEFPGPIGVEARSSWSTNSCMDCNLFPPEPAFRRSALSRASGETSLTAEITQPSAAEASRHELIPLLPVTMIDQLFIASRVINARGDAAPGIVARHGNRRWHQRGRGTNRGERGRSRLRQSGLLRLSHAASAFRRASSEREAALAALAALTMTGTMRRAVNRIELLRNRRLGFMRGILPLTFADPTKIRRVRIGWGSDSSFPATPTALRSNQA